MYHIVWISENVHNGKEDRGAYYSANKRYIVYSTLFIHSNLHLSFTQFTQKYRADYSIGTVYENLFIFIRFRCEPAV